MEDLYKLLLTLTLSLILGLLLLNFLDFLKEESKSQQFTYMEKAGIGIVLGKTETSFWKFNKVVIQFKDTIVFVKDISEENFYLLEKGDSIEVKNGEIIKKTK